MINDIFENIRNADIFMTVFITYSRNAEIIDENVRKTRYSEILRKISPALSKYNKTGYTKTFTSNIDIFKDIKRYLFNTYQEYFYSCNNCMYNTYCDEYKDVMSENGEMVCEQHAIDINLKRG